MNPLRTLLVIIRPSHVAFTQSRIDSEEHLGSDLSAQERRLLVPEILPLWEILGDLGQLDAGRRLRVRGMRRWLLHLCLWHALLHGIEMGVLSCRCGDEERVDARAGCLAWERELRGRGRWVLLWLRRVHARCQRRGYV